MKTEQIYERITANIIELLEEHKQSNYTQSWYNLKEEVFARNIVTQHIYSGINQLMLSYVKRKMKYPYNRWLTFKQIQKYNAHITKGSKTAMVVYTSNLYFDQDTGQNITRTIEAMLRNKQSIKHLNYKKVGYLKDYRVFNVGSVEGLPKEFYEQKELEQLTDIDRDERADSIISNFGVDIIYEAQNEAYYKPSTDTIYMPLPKQFTDKETFYSVIYHEIGHATGHSSRLDRPMNNVFGDTGYAFEELIGELTSAYMLAFLGYESRITNNVDYINNWLSVMQNDKKFVIQAASQAQAASNYILQTANIEEVAA